MPEFQQDMPWIEAIVQVLEEAGEAMHYTDIAEEIIERGLRVNYGATPAQTVANYIAHHRQNKGIVRVEAGFYTLQSILDSHIGEQDADEEVVNLIQAFGLFWDRDNVKWKNPPEILGKQSIGADPVDLSEQIGIYVLYDRREPIYVGRTIDGSIGQRLLSHTNGRLGTRWDRFSWFGFLPVREDGSLGSAMEEADFEEIIEAMESILIEIIEPRQNRRGGDNLSGLEFMQAEDPEIAKEDIRANLIELLQRV